MSPQRPKLLGLLPNRICSHLLATLSRVFTSTRCTVGVLTAVQECGELHRAAGGALQQLCKVSTSGPVEVLSTSVYLLPSFCTQLLQSYFNCLENFSKDDNLTLLQIVLKKAFQSQLFNSEKAYVHEMVSY